MKRVFLSRHLSRVHTLFSMCTFSRYHTNAHDGMVESTDVLSSRNILETFQFRSFTTNFRSLNSNDLFEDVINLEIDSREVAVIDNERIEGFVEKFLLEDVDDDFCWINISLYSVIVALIIVFAVREFGRQFGNKKVHKENAAIVPFKESLHPTLLKFGRKMEKRAKKKEEKLFQKKMKEEKLFQKNKKKRMKKISEVIPGSLFLSSVKGANNHKEVSKRGISVVVSLLREDQIPRLEYVGGVTYYYFPLADKVDPNSDILSLLPYTYTIIKRAIQRNEKVLVHCNCGVSRSSSIVISFLMKEFGYSFDEALGYLLDVRNIVRPNQNFRKQLKVYEEQLQLPQCLRDNIVSPKGCETFRNNRVGETFRNNRVGEDDDDIQEREI